MNFSKVAIGLVLGVFLVGGTYFISRSSGEKLQANVHTNVVNGKFPDVATACPNQVADFGKPGADYNLAVFWEDGKGWFYELERKDGAALGPDFYAKGAFSPNASKVVRKVCRDIESDFPLWLNTQRLRASIGKPAQIGATASVDDDPPRRYEMMEYRNGPIIGQALLDTKLGRVWTITNIVNSAGKTERTEFEEISVENLWKSEDEAPADLAEWRVKKLTRPEAIQRAEEEAEKER